MTRLVVIIILAWIVYIWFEWWVVYTINHDIEKKEKKDDELKDEIEWWKKQTKEALTEVNDWKRKFNDMQCKYNKERNKVFELEQNLEAYLKGKKGRKKRETFADKNEEAIRELFNSWLSDKKIADKLGCGKSTIQRAVKKFWLR